MRRVWVRAASTFAAVIVVIALGGVLSRRWPIADPVRRSAIIAQLSASSGLTVDAAGPMALRLLPRPTIRIAGLALSGLGGAVAVDADGLAGRLSLGALLHGQWHVATTVLKRPTIVIDLDRTAPLFANMIGAPPDDNGAAASAGSPAGRFRFLQTAGLTIRSGVVRFLSADSQRDMLLADLSGTLAWPDDGSTAALSGTALWRGTRVSLDAELSAPADLSMPTGTITSVRLQSPVLDLVFNGTLVEAGALRGTGRLSAATQDLPGFLRAIGTPAPQLAAFRDASVSGDATITADTLSLSDVDLGLDSMAFQGALAIHRNAGRPGLAGTLDTDRIDLDPFLRALPRLKRRDGTWSKAALAIRPTADDDIDLRISASHASVDGLHFDDGSLSLQSGKGRMELSLGEAHAYDGLLKGRVLATADGDGTDVRADLSVSRLDLRKLMKDITPSRILAGTATGHLSVGGQGRSPAEVIGGLDGRGQVSIRDGTVGSRMVQWVDAQPLGGADSPAAAWPARPGSFESASAGFDVTRGSALLTDAWVLWPDARAVVTGSASIPDQQLDLQAVVNAISDSSEADKAAPTAVALTGPWKSPSLAPAERRPPVPATVDR